MVYLGQMEKKLAGNKGHNIWGFFVWEMVFLVVLLWDINVFIYIRCAITHIFVKFDFQFEQKELYVLELNVFMYVDWHRYFNSNHITLKYGDIIFFFYLVKIS